MAKNDANSSHFTGNLGRDPETKYLDSGKCVTTFSIGVGKRTKDGEGTTWVRLVAWDKLAEICGEYLKKGSRVYVEGRLETRDYEQEGQKRTSTEIVLREMIMLDKKEG